MSFPPYSRTTGAWIILFGVYCLGYIYNWKRRENLGWSFWGNLVLGIQRNDAHHFVISPSWRDGGHIAFGADLVSVGVASCLYSWTNGWILAKLAQTVLGWGKEVIRFWWPWPLFHGHTSTLNVKFWPKIACLHPISWTKWWIQTKRYVLRHCDSQRFD